MYYHKYLKYKKKYLDLKKNIQQMNGSGEKISLSILDLKINYIINIYNEVKKSFNNIYLTGSSAILLLAYSNNNIDLYLNGDLELPNDVDIITQGDYIHKKTILINNNILNNNNNNPVRSTTFSNSNMNIDISTQERINRYISLNIKDNIINIIDLNIIIDDYEENLHLENKNIKKKQYDEIKIKLLYDLIKKNNYNYLNNSSSSSSSSSNNIKKIPFNLDDD